MLVIVLIAIGLSMDAFSLSLAYGMLGLNKKKIHILSVIVAVYHFLMPLIGMLIGSKIIHLLPVPSSAIVFFILFIIGIQMIIESYKKTDSMPLTTVKDFLFFGLAVSIDSFSLGIGLNLIIPHYFFAALVFAIISGVFTFIGLNIGKRLNLILGKITLIIGGLMLIFIGFLYLFG